MFNCSNRKGKKVGAGANKSIKQRTNNSSGNNNGKGAHNNSGNTYRKLSVSSSNNSSSNSSFKKDSKSKVFKPTLPPSLLASSSTADFSDTEGMYLHYN